MSEGIEGIESIDRSLVAIIDIESFTQRNAADQARLVRAFVDDLNSRLGALSHLEPDAWSTGDGAIVSIGRKCTIDESSAGEFLDFIVDFVGNMLNSGVIVRTAINYAERDRLVPIPGAMPLKGEYIQVGNTVNDAARIITFCEPREILVDEKVVRLLRDLDLEARHRFVSNEPFRTKHQQVLRTYSYEPPPSEDHFYSPTSPLHKYKRFSNFPPIKSETLEYFISTGLEFEIRRVVSHAYEAMETINDSKTFLSWSPVLKVLVQLAYDPDDDVVIVSRNDQPGFWTQARRREYLACLRRNSVNGYINQTRVMVYDDLVTSDGTAHASDLMTPSDKELHEALMQLHRTNSYYSYPSSQLFRHERIHQLRFGFTLSRKHNLAVIPVPAPDDVEIGHLTADGIGDLLARYPDYDPVDGPMKAIITADSRFIAELDREYRDILMSSEVTMLK